MFGRFYALAPDEGAGGGFDATMDAIAAQYPQGGQDAPPPAAAPAPAAAPTPPPSAPPASDPLAGLNPSLAEDDMPYREAKRLRDEIVRAREKYGPYAEAFADLDEADAETMLEIARSLADGDRESVAEFLAKSAQHVGGEGWTWPDGSPAPEGAPGASAPETPAEPAYLTEEQLEAKLAQRDQEAAIAEAQREMLDEIRGFGYDPESTDPIQRARFASLVELARLDPDGSIENAHKALTGWEQQIRDDYVQGKTADAGRPAQVDGGETPVETASLETLDDAEAAMRARMDQSFGPR